MKPWICEDTKFGGRELGGNIVILASLEAKFHIEIHFPNIKNFITDNLFIITIGMIFWDIWTDD